MPADSRQTSKFTCMLVHVSELPLPSECLFVVTDKHCGFRAVVFFLSREPALLCFSAMSSSTSFFCLFRFSFVSFP